MQEKLENDCCCESIGHVLSKKSIKIYNFFNQKKESGTQFCLEQIFQNAIQYFPLEQKRLRKNSIEKNTIIWIAVKTQEAQNKSFYTLRS